MLSRTCGVRSQTLGDGDCARAVSGKASTDKPATVAKAAAETTVRTLRARPPANPVPRLAANRHSRPLPVSLVRGGDPSREDRAEEDRLGGALLRDRLSRGMTRPANCGRSSALGSRLSALGSRLSALGSRLSALGSRLSALGSYLQSRHLRLPERRFPLSPGHLRPARARRPIRSPLRLEAWPRRRAYRTRRGGPFPRSSHAPCAAFQTLVFCRARIHTPRMGAHVVPAEAREALRATVRIGPRGADTNTTCIGAQNYGK